MLINANVLIRDNWTIISSHQYVRPIDSWYSSSKRINKTTAKRNSSIFLEKKWMTLDKYNKTSYSINRLPANRKRQPLSQSTGCDVIYSSLLQVYNIFTKFQQYKPKYKKCALETISFSMETNLWAAPRLHAAKYWINLTSHQHTMEIGDSDRRVKRANQMHQAGTIAGKQHETRSLNINQKLTIDTN